MPCRPLWVVLGTLARNTLRIVGRTGPCVHTATGVPPRSSWVISRRAGSGPLRSNPSSDTEALVRGSMPACTAYGRIVWTHRLAGEVTSSVTP